MQRRKPAARGRPAQLYSAYMRKFVVPALLALAFTAAAQQPYKVIVPAPHEAEGTEARLVDYDSGRVIATATVRDLAARFSGEIDESVIAWVEYPGYRTPDFILESGTVSFNAEEGAFGSMLNDQLRAAKRRSRSLAPKARAAMADSIIEANSDNALGYLFFIRRCNDKTTTAAERKTLIRRYPDFAKRIKD